MLCTNRVLRYSFDSRANGYGRGEGVATVVLKRLEDAVKAGDPIRAVIRGTQLNQDGKTETITSPSQQAQEQLIRTCYRKAGLNLDSSQYFEAHGTGTPTGDPIELSAAASVFQRGPSAGNPLWIGSVKSNLGHTETTSGLASLIKVTLALEKGVIPPSINLEKPNPKLLLDQWNFKIPRQCEPWQPGSDGSRRASISNFGYGGANSHVIIEDWQPGQTTGDHRVNANGHTNGSKPSNGHGGLSEPRSRLFVLSARDELACRAVAANLRRYLEDATIANEDEFLDDLAYTLGQRRNRFPWVTTCAAGSVQSLVTALEDTKVLPVRIKDQPPRVGFVFTGQGAQWHAMGRELIDVYPSFKASILEGNQYLKEFGCDWSLLEELLRDAETSRVGEPLMSTPLCVAVQVSLVRLMESWGITPTAVCSHSSGEIASAYAVGALSYRSAMAVSYCRAGSTPTSTGGNGGMLAVGVGTSAAEAMLKQIKSGRANVACINSPSSVTLSGDVAAIEELEVMAKEQHLFARRLRVATAYHSHYMEPGSHAYLEQMRLAGVGVGEPALKPIRYASPTTGTLMSTADEIRNPEHWVNSLLRPVQFVDAFREMALDSGTGQATVDVVIEVGPHAALSGPIADILMLPEFRDTDISYLSCLVRKLSALGTMHTLARQLLCKGALTQLGAINFPLGSHGIHVLRDLPPYPWTHQVRHWCDSRINKCQRDREHLPHDLLGSMVAEANPKAPIWRHVIRTSELPWVRDHSVQSTIVYPAAGFICMAVEAIRQTTQAANSQEISGYRFRDIDCQQALVVPDDSAGVDVQIQLRPVTDKAIGVRDWREFELTSTGPENKWTTHCRGLVKVVFKNANEEQVTQTSLTPMINFKRHEAQSREILAEDMFAGMQAAGFCYGPLFQNLTSVRAYKTESVTTITVADVRSKMPAKYQQPHVLHPTTLDSAFVSAYSALPGAGADSQESTKIPRAIKSLWISHDISAEPGHTFQAYSSTDRSDTNGFQSDVCLVDDTLGMCKPLMVIEGLKCQTLGAALPRQLETYKKEICGTMTWRPDLRFMEMDVLNREIDSSFTLEDVAPTNQITELVKRFVHQNPCAKILEVDAGTGDLTRAVLEVLGNGVESGFGPLASEYHHTDISSSSFDTLKEDLAAWGDLTTYRKLDVRVDPSRQGFSSSSYDLIIARVRSYATKALPAVLENIQKLLKPGARMVVHATDASTIQWNSLLKGAGFSGVDLELTGGNIKDSDPSSVILSTAEPVTRSPCFSPVALVYGSTPLDEIWVKNLQDRIAAITGASTPFVDSIDSVDAKDKVCVFLGEIHEPILIKPSPSEFDSIKRLALNCKGLLWVTRGGAAECKNPMLALSQGFLRSLRNEYSGKPYVSLDLDPQRAVLGQEDVSAIAKVLAYSFDDSLSDQEAVRDFDFAERHGLLLTPRLYKDFERNSLVSSDAAQGKTPQPEALHQSDRPLRLEVGTPGLLETLAFNDHPEACEDIGTNFIEVEPKTIALNFRDVMVAMGQLNETRMGWECAGIISRAGSSAELNGYKVGDRVFCLLNGQFANKVRLPWATAYHMPTAMTFEAAASIPMVFATAYKALYDIARLQNGQSVLIHAAAGGVGQAAIILAQLAGAEVFATVGSQEKRDFIMEKYSIPADHIFSSRDASFGPKLMGMTNGVDVVLNSLSGPLLQESFNCLAPYGHFVEIGKFDLERNSYLELARFSRVASFSSVDMAALLRDRPSEIHRILGHVAGLMEKKAISAVEPITVFPVSEIEKAFRQMQAGKHMGKIVVSINPEDTVPVSIMSNTGAHANGELTCRVQVIPHQRSVKLRPDSSYLIVGGVHGIGRSIAQWMLAHGARTVILLSRSAKTTGATGDFVAQLEKDHPGSRVVAIGCDITSKTDLALALDRCAKELPPIRGAVQGAMVIDDSIFEQMTVDQYNAAVGPKVQGTWNLHEELGGDLDFFIMLSSLAGIIGYASSSNYTAGGTFQDALAKYRVAKGLPAVTLDLGIVKGVGLVATKKSAHERMTRHGHLPLSEAQVLAAVESSILHPSPQIMVGLNTGPGPHWDESTGSPLARELRFSALRYRASSEANTGASRVGGHVDTLASKLAAASSPDEATDLIVEAMTKKLVDIFMIPIEEVSASKSMAEFGVDSLVAVELRNMLALQAGSEISIFDILQSPSLMALSSTVAEKSVHVAVS